MAGQVQGVGFRPFVWRCAQAEQLAGFVRNDADGVTIEVQGDPSAIAAFCAQLTANPPPLAVIDAVEQEELPLAELSSGDPREFVIVASAGRSGASTPTAPDISICDDCRRELFDPADRRHRYPFINCTNCGPRFTIVQDIPYDRPLTTMKSFVMCPACQREYDDPTDRRFHAQPNACPACGPQIWFAANADSAAESEPGDHPQGDTAIAAFAEWIRRGGIVAVKGIGGFHLACEATSPSAVAELRERKRRTDKPLAVMAASVDAARQFAHVDAQQQQLLESRERPIVLLRKRSSAQWTDMLQAVAPGNDFIGVMLPYSPLHHLLIEQCAPLVMTSGNVSDEPIVRTSAEAATRLAKLADGFLLHNREINAVCDDSVVRTHSGRLLPIRRSRGYAPMPIRLAAAGPSVLAVGGEIKATFCVTKDDYAYMSQHIGDVGNLETLDALRRNVQHFLRLYRVAPAAVAGDLHPDYLSSRWGRELAAELGVPLVPVQHHAAHATALAAEHQLPADATLLACCFDGTGFGPDGAIWGGEFLLSRGAQWDRVAHLNYFPLPGGDACIKRPYRAALALLGRCGLPADERLPSVAHCPSAELKILAQQIAVGLNCVDTSSAGRLFDAVASLAGVRHEVSYEAQAAMELEALAAHAINDEAADAASLGYEFELTDGEPLVIGYQSLLQAVCRDAIAGVGPAPIAGRFHAAVADMIVGVCQRLQQSTGFDAVGLTGGVFQNVLLAELTEARLCDAGFHVLSHHLVPPNDGGIALGQAIIAQAQLSSPVNAS